MSRRQQMNLLRIFIGAALLLSGLVLPNRTIRVLMHLSAYFLAGYDVLSKAVGGIFRGQLLDENFLMAVATVGAIAIGDYAEAAAVMVLYQTGEWFQGYAVGKSRNSISDLLQLCPDEAIVLRDGESISVMPEDVSVGETIVVKAGEKIPLDGTVISGTSSLNTSALTGESLPRDIQPGDQVISGCVNLSGVLHIRVDKEYADSTVSQILEMVENAADRKSRTESFITRFAKVYTPAVCIGALLLFLIPVLFLNGNIRDWAHRALSFLVVSCPCALVISVPLSYFGGIGAASRCGILMKGSNELEALSQVHTIAMDKTGTLTKGCFEVKSIHPVAIDEKSLLHMIASAEQHSNHPISRSVCAYTDASDYETVENIQEIAGQGILCHYQGKLLAVGNERLMIAQGVTPDVSPHSGTIIHAALDHQYMGCLTIADTLKENAKDVLRLLRKLGIEKTVMLTGDNQHHAEVIAEMLDIDQVYANLLPGDKVLCLENLIAKSASGTKVAYIGDGINDAPVLMRADIGIAMGAMGSDAAVEAADIVLMDDNLGKMATAIQISRKTTRIARQNILFALAIKALVLLLAAFGHTQMWLAIVADVGVSVLAILNAMRTLQYKPDISKQ